MVVASRSEQQGFGIGPEKLAHARQDEMADDLGAGRSSRLTGDEHVLLRSLKTFRQSLDLRGFSRSLAAFEGNETAAARAALDVAVGHDQSFSALARNMPITSSLAPSMARRMVEPVPTDSAA